jgi:hypothetical protein
MFHAAYNSGHILHHFFAKSATLIFQNLSQYEIFSREMPVDAAGVTLVCPFLYFYRFSVAQATQLSGKVAILHLQVSGSNPWIPHTWYMCEWYLYVSHFSVLQNRNGGNESIIKET